MPKVTFRSLGEEKTVEGVGGQTILKIALEHAIPMEHACGGNGFCTTCMCSVRAGAEHLSPRNEREENMGITKEPYRLGCQARVQGEGEVIVDLEN